MQLQMLIAFQKIALHSSNNNQWRTLLSSFIVVMLFSAIQIRQGRQYNLPHSYFQGLITCNKNLC